MNPDDLPNGGVLEHPDAECWWWKLADGSWMTDNEDWPEPYDDDGNPLAGCRVIALPEAADLAERVARVKAAYGEYDRTVMSDQLRAAMAALTGEDDQ